jgi:hypothetical protein
MRRYNPKALLSLLPIALAMTTSAGFANAKSCAWTPTSVIVGKIEADLKMPHGLSLKSYRRYYSGEIAKNHHVVVAVFLKSDRPGTEIVQQDKLPRVLDSGCSVVTLHYDVELQKILMLRCNGVG